MVKAIRVFQNRLLCAEHPSDGTRLINFIFNSRFRESSRQRVNYTFLFETAIGVIGGICMLIGNPFGAKLLAQNFHYSIPRIPSSLMKAR
jgi:hypothetical protein